MDAHRNTGLPGRIVEPLPNRIYRVALEDGREVLAHIGGQLRFNIVRLVPGDRVTVELVAHDAGRGRIIARVRP